jgi:hypothetical protein
MTCSHHFLMIFFIIIVGQVYQLYSSLYYFHCFSFLCKLPYVIPYLKNVNKNFNTLLIVHINWVLCGIFIHVYIVYWRSLITFFLTSLLYTLSFSSDHILSDWCFFSVHMWERICCTWFSVFGLISLNDP